MQRTVAGTDRKRLKKPLLVMIIAICLLSSYSLLWAFFLSAVPNVRVDYLKVLNESNASISLDERAWPIYRSALITDWDRFVRFRSHHMFSKDHPFRLVAVDEDQWSETSRELGELRRLLDTVRRGGQLSYLGLDLYASHEEYQPDDQFVFHDSFQDYEQFYAIPEIEGFPKRIKESVSRCLLACPTPHVYLLHDIVRVLILDTRLAIHENDVERAVTNIESCFGIADQTSNIRLAVESAVSIKFHAMAIAVMKELAEESNLELDHSQIARLKAVLLRTDLFQQHDPTSKILVNNDLVQRCFTDNGAGDGHLTNDWYWHMRLLNVLAEVHLLDDMKLKPREESMSERVTEWLCRPFIVFSSPSRAKVTATLHDHKRLMQRVWQPPYDRKALEDVIHQISLSSLPPGINNNFFVYLNYYDEIVDINAQREALRQALEDSLKKDP